MARGLGHTTPAGDLTEAPAVGMRFVPGGTFAMGSEDFYPEERPVHRVSVDGFWMDEHPVTAAEFRRFVRETEYVTVAERPLDAETTRTPIPDLLVPGSLVFRRSAGPVDLRDFRNWWEYVPGAQWRRPGGKGTTINGRDRHPVVHVACEDAETYAAWAGKELPTEAEWELAARGGLDGAVFAWGDEHFPDGKPMANTWQGEFPWQNLKVDGYEGTSPVGSFPPNGYGLYDITGNVWEWTADWYTPRHPDEVESPCCVPRIPASPRRTRATAPVCPASNIPRRVIKGGSHLCAPNYCLRYRPAARQSQMIDTSMAHLGFRCIVRPSEPRKKQSPDGRQAEHPRDLGRRHRDHEPELLQRRADGLPDAEHRPHRERGDALHGRLRRAELHRRAGGVHHGAERLPYRAQQGRAPGRPVGLQPEDPTIAELLKEQGYCDGPVRQEPSRGQERVPADRARVRRVLRQPLPPERGGGSGGSRLPGEARLRAVPRAVRPARRPPVSCVGEGRSQGAPALGSRRQAADQGHGPADPEADGDLRRRVRRRRGRLHPAPAQPAQALLLLGEHDAHAPADAHQAEESRQGRPLAVAVPRHDARPRPERRPAARPARPSSVSPTTRS